MTIIKRIAAGLLIGATMILSGCGGSGGGGGSSDQPAPQPAPTPSPVNPGPTFAGFDFALQTGAFWEYRWTYSSTSGSQGSPATTKTDTGRFWAVLGPARTIAGVTAYEVQLYGKGSAADTTPHRFMPRWRYLSLSNNKLSGSIDGTTLETVFDAQEGKWPGGGFFTGFSNSKLTIAEAGTLVNNFISTPAIRAGVSVNQSQCEYFPGIGTICGDSSVNLTEDEYYKPSVGPVGYHFANSFSFCGGGFCSFGSSDHHLGMTASSFTGGTLPFVSESSTLHNGPTNAQTLTIPAVIRGEVHESDGGFSTTVFINNQSIPVVIEDWYKLVVSAQRSITVTLSFESSPTSDVDLYVFTDGTRGPQLFKFSVGDNVNLNYFNEALSATFAAGTYYVAIDAWKTPGGRVPYVLQIE
jgi:hypothetical protein